MQRFLHWGIHVAYGLGIIGAWTLVQTGTPQVSAIIERDIVALAAVVIPLLLKMGYSDISRKIESSIAKHEELLRRQEQSELTVARLQQRLDDLEER